MIRLIAAIDRSRGIAKGGLQPWKITTDEQYFRDKTLEFGANILMGRRTFEVIGHTLPDRRNFIAAREGDLQVSGGEVVHDLPGFINNFTDDLWIIGGASIFEQTLPFAHELYLTHIDADFGCDQFFPQYEQQFELTERSDLQEENGFIFTYNKYVVRP